MNKFIAKAVMSEEDLDLHGIPHTSGFVTGYLVDDLIVGGLIDVEEECLITEYWCKVEKNTIKYLGGNL